MKKIFKTIVACLFLLSMHSCNNEEPNGGGTSEVNNLKAGQIEIKAYPDQNNKLSFYAAAKSLTIDWGDGSIDVITSNGVGKEIIHEYTNQNFQTIKINTEGLELIIICHNTSYPYNTIQTKGACHELRFGSCPDLKEIRCNSRLTELSIKSAPALTKLYCYNNQLTSLNMSGCPALAVLNCSFNQLTSLNVSGCTALGRLECFNNQLTSLNISGCTALRCLYCHYNQLTDIALNSVFNNLLDREGRGGGGYDWGIYIDNNPGAYTCDRTIAENKGWSFWEIPPLDLFG